MLWSGHLRRGQVGMVTRTSGEMEKLGPVKWSRGVAWIKVKWSYGVA